MIRSCINAAVSHHPSQVCSEPAAPSCKAAIGRSGDLHVCPACPRRRARRSPAPRGRATLPSTTSASLRNARLANPRDLRETLGIPEDSDFAAIGTRDLHQICTRHRSQPRTPQRDHARPPRNGQASVVRWVIGDVPEWLRKTLEKCEVQLNPQAIAIWVIDCSVCTIRLRARWSRISTM